MHAGPLSLCEVPIAPLLYITAAQMQVSITSNEREVVQGKNERAYAAQ